MTNNLVLPLSQASTPATESAVGNDKLLAQPQQAKGCKSAFIIPVVRNESHSASGKMKLCPRSVRTSGKEKIACWLGLLLQQGDGVTARKISRPLTLCVYFDGPVY